MGRNRPNKPRRDKAPRQRGYTLQELQPPGEDYKEWIEVPSGLDTSKINDPQIGAEEIDFLHRLARLAPVYGSNVPVAGIVLDTVIDTGQLPIYSGEGTGRLIPLQQVAAAYPEFDSESVRESIHRLHAAGAFLVVSDAETELSLVRFVSRKPEHPGDPWGFIDDKSVPAATTCVPTEMWDELPLSVATAVLYLRSCESRLEEPAPKDLLRFDEVESLEQAQELWDKAHDSGYVDYKGCEACPTGHLCTRRDD
ncbi:hypothetical protein [Streptomyces sp. NPDC047981]|uniref:hypothetical protein n=1 Tax=Streptomyces sp. NPDC047981 TaxID=3154610 RepID=UPI003437A915